MISPTSLAHAHTFARPRLAHQHHLHLKQLSCLHLVTTESPTNYHCLGTWITHRAMFSSLLLFFGLFSSTSRRFRDSICKHYILQCTTTIFFNLLQGILLVVYRYEGIPTRRRCVTLRTHNWFHVAPSWRVLKVRFICCLQIRRHTETLCDVTDT
jgi:hypothetical protein